MTGTLGAVWVAFGENALREATESRTSFLKHHRYPAKVLTKPNFSTPVDLTTDQRAHWAKVNSYLWSPFDYTLMLDADTRVKGDLSLGFKLLREGWDLILVPSVPPRPGAVLWSLAEIERRTTMNELGIFRHTMFNTGVMFFRKSRLVQGLFEAWRSEWLRYKDRDQGALLRALQWHPVRLWLLGPPFNSAGGEVVDHLFGRAR